MYSPRVSYFQPPIQPQAYGYTPPWGWPQQNGAFMNTQAAYQTPTAPVINPASIALEPEATDPAEKSAVKLLLTVLKKFPALKEHMKPEVLDNLTKRVEIDALHLKDLPKLIQNTPGASNVLQKVIDLQSPSGVVNWFRGWVDWVINKFSGSRYAKAVDTLAEQAIS